MKILKGSKEYLRAVDKDYQLPIDFSDLKSIYQPSLISKSINELKQFNIERNLCNNYILYGKIENLIDDGLHKISDHIINETNYTISVGYIDKLLPFESDMVQIISIKDDSVTVSVRFEPNDVIIIYKSGKMVFNRVIDVIELNKMYILKLDNVDGLTLNHKIVPSVTTYRRYFKEIVSKDYIKVFNSGFSTNIFGEQIYQYNTYKNIDISSLLDNFNIPITSLFIKLTPKITYKQYYEDQYNVEIPETNLVDLVRYNLNELTHEPFKKINYVINKSTLDYYFEPFYEFQIKTKSDVVIDSNVNNLFTYPDYSIKFKNGDVLYKEILEIGSFENDLGLDYPYVNNLHYVYKDIKFFIRRISIIASYLNLESINSDSFADDLVNDNVSKKRLC